MEIGKLIIKNNQMMGNTFQSIKSDDEKNYIILDVVFSKLHDYGTKERVNSKRKTGDHS